MLRKTFTVSSQPVHVIDGLFGRDEVEQIFEHVRSRPYVLFNYRYRAALDGLEADDWQWIHAIDAPGIELQHPFAPLIAAAEEVHGGALGFRRAHVNCHAYGDHRHPHIDMPPAGARGITALYFVNPRWDVDWGGELVFFEAGEPSIAIHPAPGRLVVFDGTLLHRGGVPARDAGQRRYTLAIKLAEQAAG